MTDLQRAPGLRLHPRTMPVQKAEGHLKRYLWDFQKEYDLTDIELLRALIECQVTVTKVHAPRRAPSGRPRAKGR